MFAAVRGCDGLLVEYRTEPRHCHERRILATPDVEEAAPAAMSDGEVIRAPFSEEHILGSEFQFF